jgi:hypothetical protein
MSGDGMEIWPKLGFGSGIRVTSDLLLTEEVRATENSWHGPEAIG